MNHNNDARELAAFAQRWAPYGGGHPGDILVEFGLTEREYFTRLREVLPQAGLDAQTTATIERVATRRLRGDTDDREIA